MDTTLPGFSLSSLSSRELGGGGVAAGKAASPSQAPKQARSGPPKGITVHESRKGGQGTEGA